MRTPSHKQSDEASVPLVQLVGRHFPETELLFFHPVWSALDPKVAIDVDSVNRLLRKVASQVSDQFIEYDDRQTSRDHKSVGGLWNFPYGGSLSADFLAAYLLLYREARAQQRDDVYEHGAVHVLDAVKEMRASPLWAPFRRQVLVHIANSFFACERGHE